QNEPAAEQEWDSCLYTGEEEGIFAVCHLRKELDKAGLTDVKILIWDHNKDQIIERCEQSFAVEGAKTAIAGIAYHWYSGDHFEALQYVSRKYPDKEIIFTEGCVEYSRFAASDQTENAEMYAHNIIGDLNAGMSGFLDWNLLLDHQGGPNHVYNFCDAPIMCNCDADTIDVKLSYYYIGHFSRFIKPGAVRLLTSSYNKALECAAFENPDGERLAVILNAGEEEQVFSLYMEGKATKMYLEGHSIMTAVI
ncbi:MAG TPA: glycoside hydrolase family 30 beta sandwich domain-containing protein, partial [Lachnospiraceae bacterium]|nr:glycoside hydrolase family 30 beta sandwich domain-containing protein [Lachnospiraceae bacterium]